MTNDDTHGQGLGDVFSRYLEEERATDAAPQRPRTDGVNWSTHGIPHDGEDRLFAGLA